MVIKLKSCTVYLSLPLIAGIGCKEKNPAPRPNIILIMADDVDTEHLSCYGGKIPPPHIDRLAKEGMIFTRGYCVSAASTPSRYSILTGQYPGRCNAPEYLKENPPENIACIEWNTPLNEKTWTLHRLLKSAGYQTAFTGKFHVGNLRLDEHTFNPLIPPFDENSNPADDSINQKLQLRQNLLNQYAKQLAGCDTTAAIQWENPDEQPLKKLRVHHLEWLTSATINILKHFDKNKPFFLHFNTSALHGPCMFHSLKANPLFTPEGKISNPFLYHPPRATIIQRMIAMGIDTTHTPPHVLHYIAGIMWLDDQIGCLLDELDKQGLKENTLIIFSADHSIEPGKGSCYNKGVHVPFLVRWPARIPAGSICHVPVQFTDFMPTFAELAGQKLPEQPCDGLSIVPLFNGKKIANRSLYFEIGYSRAIMHNNYKLICTRFPEKEIQKIEEQKEPLLTHFGARYQAHAMITMDYFPAYFDADQLYDLKHDPYEQKNMASSALSDSLKKALYDSLDKKLTTFHQVFPLADTSWKHSSSFVRATKNAKSLGQASVSWWQRKLDFPPHQ